MPFYFIVLALLLASASTVAAQDFPTKPIELVLPYGPGGSHDLTARAIASGAQQHLGQHLLVVLKPGGGGAVGSQTVIRAKPDGYTLMLGGTGPNTIFALVQKAPIGPDQFTPIARMNYSPPVFAVHTIPDIFISSPSVVTSAVRCSARRSVATSAPRSRCR